MSRSGIPGTNTTGAQPIRLGGGLRREGATLQVSGRWVADIARDVTNARSRPSIPGIAHRETDGRAGPFGCQAGASDAVAVEIYHAVRRSLADCPGLPSPGPYDAQLRGLMGHALPGVRELAL